MPFSLINPSTTHVPSLVSVWYDAFSSPGFEKVMPNTPLGRDWLGRSVLQNLSRPDITPRNVEYRAIVDDNHESEGGDEEEKGKGEGEGEGEGKEKMVALIRLLKYGEGEYEMDWTTRWPLPLVEGMSEQLMGEGFFEPMARQHVSAMGERGHFLLEVLAADPEYHGRGAGSMLLTWACEKADREGLEIYLDGAAKAVPLYRRFGFVVLDCRDEKAVSEPMVRKPRVER